MKEGALINVRRLVALDMALHGRSWITAEFIFGVFGIVVISVFTYAINTAFGAYMTFLALNYVPPLAYAILIGSQKNARKEARIEMSNLKKYGPKYGFQQLLIFVPLSMIILSILQEISKK